MVCLPEVAWPLGAKAVAEKLLAVLAEIATVEGHDVAVSARIGVVCFSDDSEVDNALVECPDAAMYSAK